MCNEVIYSVVVPLYNEELVIDESYKRIKKVMYSTNENYEIIFINDGSTDRTKDKAELICSKDEKIKLLNFSRNFGHQSAITAGMNSSIGDAIIVIDGDLQDPPEIIPNMIDKWKEGYEVVYAKRSKREGETFFKKFTAKTFYRLLDNMTTVNIPVDTGDFRLIDRKVCNALNCLSERNRYMRGLVSWVGYKQTSIEINRKERFAGQTKYSLKKMMQLALDGIISFSYKPLVISGYLGVLILLIGIFSFICIIIRKIYNHTQILSFSLILSINFVMFGLILLAIGIMGEYIGRIFDEGKARPNYIISSRINFKKDDKNI
ncbi:glycosyltransferase family 2 protein [Clostridium sp.]|jgi:dolichol-phosphate mannosyltransferase|uniref:glycosyltransferase family 2 protein n=1 Tax=Clostridium sp. TaxID=1506 RepID=UPI00258861EE|nr:glycosyltransferase family 2 protein [Clostridium sp.]MDF2505885.1 cell wall biosynthesis glycosyltransferase [Clostridium sp.]